MCNFLKDVNESEFEEQFYQESNYSASVNSEVNEISDEFLNSVIREDNIKEAVRQLKSRDIPW